MTAQVWGQVAGQVGAGDGLGVGAGGGPGGAPTLGNEVNIVPSIRAGLAPRPSGSQGPC